MRKIGNTGDAKAARKFGLYLDSLGIENAVREGDAGVSVWVLDEDKVGRAESELRAFAAEPGAERYAEAAATAEAVKKQREESAAPPPQAAMPPSWRTRPPLSAIPVTLALIAVSIAVTVITRQGADAGTTRWLFLTPGGLERGEFWRLVTPIFLHFHILHILMNMLWLRDLGGLVESIRGRWFLLVLTAAIAVPSNYAKMLLEGPNFGGMSGVVYGLLGYLWIKGRREPWSGLFVPESTLFMMIGWLALGFSGLLNQVAPMANWVHGVGMAVGALCGYLDSLRGRGGFR